MATKRIDLLTVYLDVECLLGNWRDTVVCFAHVFPHVFSADDVGDDVGDVGVERIAVRHDLCRQYLQYSSANRKPVSGL